MSSQTSKEQNSSLISQHLGFAAPESHPSAPSGTCIQLEKDFAALCPHSHSQKQCHVKGKESFTKRLETARFPWCSFPFKGKPRLPWSCRPFMQNHESPELTGLLAASPPPSHSPNGRWNYFSSFSPLPTLNLFISPEQLHCLKIPWEMLLCQMTT